MVAMFPDRATNGAPPGARKTHAGKYRELTLLRQQGGAGESLPLTY